MYGLEKSVNLEFLIGRELIQISIGTHQVMMAFDRDVHITIEGLCELSFDRGAPTEIHASAPNETRQLTQLVGARIDNAVNHGDGNIGLKFSNGIMVRIFDSNKTFESYQIEGPGIESIIV